ncbi:hypothetical protein ACFL0V_04435 [Nanoarchaeota archaeon]
MHQSYPWKVDRVPQSYLDFLKVPVVDAQHERLLMEAIINQNDKSLRRLIRYANKQDKPENHVNVNPLEYATMVRDHLGRDIYLDVNVFMAVMRRFPLSIWINGKPPHQSPIAARANGQKIIVGPYEKREIHGIYPAYGMIGFDDMAMVSEGGVKGSSKIVGGQCSPIPDGIPCISLSYNPTEYGVTHYQHVGLGSTVETPILSNQDDGISLRILLRHDPKLLEERL